RDAEAGNVVEFFDQAAEITHAIIVAVVEGFHVQLVNDGVLVPGRFIHGVTVGGTADSSLAGVCWQNPFSLTAVEKHCFLALAGSYVFRLTRARVDSEYGEGNLRRIEIPV